MFETTLTDGLLTDELVGRAISELSEIRQELLDGSGDHAWLVACEQRLDNALRDLTVTRDRFRKAQT